MSQKEFGQRCKIQKTVRATTLSYVDIRVELILLREGPMCALLLWSLLSCIISKFGDNKQQISPWHSLEDITIANDCFVVDNCYHLSLSQSVDRHTLVFCSIYEFYVFI